MLNSGQGRSVESKQSRDAETTAATISYRRRVDEMDTPTQIGGRWSINLVVVVSRKRKNLGESVPRQSQLRRVDRTITLQWQFLYRLPTPDAKMRGKTTVPFSWAVADWWRRLTGRVGLHLATSYFHPLRINNSNLLQTTDVPWYIITRWWRQKGLRTWWAK